MPGQNAGRVLVQSGFADRRSRASEAGSLPISDLKRYLKCENCGELSHVDLTIVWACAERT